MVGAACPDCGRFADRVHDRYQRRLKDLPLAEQGFVIRLMVRRFICGSADCPRRTFAEPFSRLAAPYARFTTRLNGDDDGYLWADTAEVRRTEEAARAWEAVRPQLP
ncbi:transposase family protein [Streptomyces erythrochromogenes]|uniref:transposase family protein n=1 Tax=Streptomyces erythrochromogenes TaxID=285574 RepID=UPI0038019CA4